MPCRRTPSFGLLLPVFAACAFAAGVRFDTSGTRKDGSRWQKGMRPTSGYVARHPPGL